MTGPPAAGGDETEGGGPGWPPPSLFPFQGHFLDLDGAAIHYAAAGTGPTFLMLHGNPTWSFVYRHIIAELQDDFHCLVPDLPGFGLSRPSPDYDFSPESHGRIIRQFVETLDLKDIILVAHDWGGPIGLKAATDMPERFAGLVIGNSWAWPLNGRLKFELFSRIMSGPVPLTRLIPLALRRKRLTRAERAAYAAPFRAPQWPASSRTLVAALRTARPFLAGLESDLSRLAHLPFLLLWGGSDPAFTATERRRFEAIFPNHQTRLLPRCGHLVPEDAPEEMARAIRSWYDRPVDDA